ncbi:MAG: methionyl-tRNA formyltransferase [Candidatus Omnitrophica bacterium]|nr:methionyl-tRNA formyltransferase [Candidatus Omnitrophota bacterium]
MNIVFFGTSGFAVPSLKALLEAGHKILLVVTQPDRKKGRHLRLTPSPVKEIATALDLPVFQPDNASDSASLERLKSAGADLFAVVSFGQILKREVLAAPKKFSVNLHASLLPRYRGAAPINWAIINGEKGTGVSVFKMEERMDAGDIILDKAIEISQEDNAVTLGERLSLMGAAVLKEAAGLIENNKVSFEKQDESFVTFAPKLKKSDGLIDWKLPASALHNRARGLLPWPSAFTLFKGHTIKILETEVIYDEGRTGVPGEVIAIEGDKGIIVKTGQGFLAVKRLQQEGSRPMAFKEFLSGHRFSPGNVLGAS